ncbi:Endoribonuclease L-PSP [Athelia psychrophila]|uniref:Endoribonuclease L-PSP n=1 Tax=Athelia psychrophila TaxID=1759441 RepID=A0A166R4G7_9AGAM|nr:Endoribonuclease L-PSP [Fibularhizoctonia sp. CBS 109695]
MKAVHTTDAFPPIPVLSQAIIAKNGTVYVSGCIGLAADRVDSKTLEVGVQAQARSAMENMGKVLKAAGSGLEHVVKTNVFLSDLPNDFAPMNEVYFTFFNKDQMPARTCIGVKNLPLGAVFEIECVAELA